MAYVSGMKHARKKPGTIVFVVWAVIVWNSFVFGPFGISFAEFRIGVLTPITGSGALYGPGMAEAVRIAADEINQTGGISGCPATLVCEDSGTNPRIATGAVQKLIRNHKVAAILGTWSSGVTMAVLPFTVRAGIIQMNVSGAPEISDIGKMYGLVFRTQASTSQFGEVYADIAKRAGYEKAATMAFDNPSGRGNTEAFVARFKAAGGVITGGLVYPGGKASYRSEIGNILATKPKIVVFGSYLNDLKIILPEWKQVDKSVRFIAGAWAVNRELLDSVGNAAEGTWAVDTIPNLSSETYSRFAESFRKRTGGEPESNPYAPKVYDQMILLALASVSAKSADPAIIKNRMRDISGPPGKTVFGFRQGKELLEAGVEIDYEGASGKIDFDESGDVSPAFGVYKVEKGKLVLKYTIENFK